MTRKLVTIREVIGTIPIEGADNIELAVVDGWQCVVKKGDFVPGQFGLYFEIDSLLPLDNPAFAFLQRPGATKTHHRLKTIKLRGTLSQGLLVRLDTPGLEAAREALLTCGGGGTGDSDINVVRAVDDGVSDDYAALLGVTKYEPPQPGESGITGQTRVVTFPGFIPRTDLERVQNLKREVQAIIEANGNISIEQHQFEVQAKYDGTSITAYYCPDVCLPEGDTYEHGVCSRNQDLKDIDNMFWRGAAEAKWLTALPIIAAACGGTVAIQGELCGPGIQSNRMKLETKRAFAFDIFSVRHARYLTRPERDLMWGLVKFQAGIEIAEVDTFAAVWFLSPLSEILVDLMATCEGSVKYPLEGIVFKSLRPNGLRFKALSNSYLLKYDA